MGASNARQQELNDKAFGVFLRRPVPGLQWAPTLPTSWETYKRIAGVEEQPFRKTTFGLPKDLTCFWFKTGYEHMWYCENRTGDGTPMARYFHFCMD
jgi:hypothetical protein